MSRPLDRLRHHVTGAIEREETEAIVEVTPRQRLEYLRKELRAERISYGELSELESLAEYIDAGDVELLEAAGVSENG
jgi:hypothetical protein